MPEFAHITYIGDAGQDNNQVIAKEPYAGMPDDIRNGKFYDDHYQMMK